MAGSSNFITFFILSISVCVKLYLCDEYPVGRCQIKHPVKELSRKELLDYGQLEDEKHLRKAVKKILIPRAVGTWGHEQVRKYISASLHKMGWFVEYDTFHENVEFHNIIAKLNPNAERFLVLTCHYDSEYSKYYKPVGAIDGVPCAMLLNMAHVLQKELNPFRNTKLSLMFIFFDGRESTVAGHGLYGSRHLANRWKNDGTLDRLDILVTLDMIGLADTTFRSFFENTEAWFSRFIALENRLSDANMLRCENPRRYFETNPIRSHHINSDYTPFLQQNVPTLHLSPEDLPSKWTTKDVKDIEYTATEDISRIIRLFLMEYLLSGIIN